MGRRPTAVISTHLSLVTALVLGGSGCATAPRRDEALRERTGVEVGAAELRLQVRTLARPFGGIIEGAADRMLFAARTPEERILALRIKISGIPAVHGALFEADPAGALFETAALLAQLLAVVLPVVFLGGLALIWYARRPR